MLGEYSHKIPSETRKDLCSSSFRQGRGQGGGFQVRGEAVAENKKWRILVADDDPPILELLGEYLATRGHDIKLASNGSQAMEFLERDEFDLLLSDLKMPGGDGLELLRFVKERDLPIATVLMTGYGTIDTALEAMRCGAHDYLLKPFRLREVYGAIEKALATLEEELETIRLKKIHSFQEQGLAARDARELDEIYSSLARICCEETQGEGAVVCMREPKQRRWVEYARTSGAPLRGIDLERVGELVALGKLTGDESAWFDGCEGELLMAPIPLPANAKQGPQTVGFVAVVNPRSRQAHPQNVLKAYCNVTGFTIGKLMGEKEGLLPGSAGSIPIEVVEERCKLAGELEALLTDGPPGGRCADWAVRLGLRSLASLREVVDGGGLEVMTVGGGGLPFNIIAPLEQSVFAIEERPDGTGSPGRLEGSEVPMSARIAAVVKHLTWLTHGRRWSARLSTRDSIANLEAAPERFDREVVERLREMLLDGEDQ